MRRLLEPRIVLAIALLVFVVHAANYLYFFVDDEGIPFVFAQHLLEGKGLVYNSFEGRVEGYSDFLQVLLSAVWIQIARLLGLGRLAPFFIGKAVAFACGIGVVATTWTMMRQSGELRPAGRLAGMAFLVLAPPLAMWSCSSLEMALVALLAATLTSDLLAADARRDTWTAAAACTLVLLRIDGFVYVAALLAPALVTASSQRRQTLLLHVVMPVSVVVVGYHAWRMWYFGDWLSAPMAAKVLYKLAPGHDIVTRKPSHSYLRAFLDLYSAWLAICASIPVAICAAISSRARPLLVSAGLLIAYAAVVGDWMAGFRFFLPVLPLLSMLIAVAVSAVPRPRLAWGLAMLAACWFGTVAVGASTSFGDIQYRGRWWVNPSLDAERFFGQYLRLYQALQRIVSPGTRIAYNQAGFVPYMLDADNLDDLGICSRFVARLPTTDVKFTEVGRYAPLTNRRALRAAHAYVLYRSPEFLIAPLDDVRAANFGSIPNQVLLGQYTLHFVDSKVGAAVYGRTRGTANEFQSNPRTFLENLASPSRLVRAYDGAVIEPGAFLARLPFLADGVIRRTFTGRVVYDVTFAAVDEPVYQVYVHGVETQRALQMTLTLHDSRGRVVARDERLLAAGQHQISLEWPEGLHASQITLELESTGTTPSRVILRDMRVQGQSPALAAYVAQLAFPPAR